MNWIPWKGGECPVPKDTLVDVEFRGGSICPNKQVRRWKWNHHNIAGDIVEYRLSEEKCSSSQE